jgi:hypothetical protein
MMIRPSLCAALVTTLYLSDLQAIAADAKQAPPPAIPGTAIGRLFFTAAERDELDRLRAGIQDGDELGGARTLRLDGVLSQSGQLPLIWVNGKRYVGRDVAGASLSARPLNASTIVVSLPPPDPRNMRLQVGQTLDPAGGNLREVYQRPPQELNMLLQVLGKRGVIKPAKNKSNNSSKNQPISTGTAATTATPQQ